MPATGSLREIYTALKAQTGGDGVRQIRDLSIVDLSAGISLVVACDSDGGIGSKEHDLVQVPGDVLGRFATRVPLMELLAAGATPILVVNTLAVEMDPSGKAIIKGVREEAVQAGLDPLTAVTGSTEDNVPTTATGMGVTIIGLVSEEELRPGRSETGDAVVCVGVPKSAPDDEVRLDDPQIADTACIRAMGTQDYIHDVLPVGSKGLVHELAELARCADLTFQPQAGHELDIHKSAGPSTCVLVSLPAGKVDTLRRLVTQPVYPLGILDRGADGSR
jgi:selenophosphate synthetase-related protein